MRLSNAVNITLIIKQQIIELAKILAIEENAHPDRMLKIADIIYAIQILFL